LQGHSLSPKRKKEKRKEGKYHRRETKSGVQRRMKNGQPRRRGSEQTKAK